MDDGEKQTIGTAAHKPYLESALSVAAATPVAHFDFFPAGYAPLVQLALELPQESHLQVTTH